MALGNGLGEAEHQLVVKGDSEWCLLHDALCRASSGFASRAHVLNKLEGGKVSGTRKKPGDIRFSGDAGTVVCPLTRQLRGGVANYTLH